MNTSTIEKTSTEPKTAENRPHDLDSKAHSGPIARLLAGVSRLAEEHATYKLSRCEWRQISI